MQIKTNQTCTLNPIGGRAVMVLGTIVILFMQSGCEGDAEPEFQGVDSTQETTQRVQSTDETDANDKMTQSFAPTMMGMDIPGISDPYFHAADEVIIPETTPVIGVIVDGKARAYMDEGMAEADQHIVHDTFGNQQLTIVYCDKSNCVRVFDSTEAELDSILMAGMKRDQLQLKVGTRDFALDDESIPIPDYESERTTWSEWKAAHPETDIYVGIGKMIGSTVKESARPPRKSDFGG